MNLKKNPMISVVMAVHNGENFIKSSVESIINQTYNNWELLIADDASTDATNEILKQIIIKIKNKIKIINIKRNIGQYKALNYLFSISKGKYIAVLDSDDLSHHKRLQIQIEEMNQDPELALVYSNFKIIDYKNKIIKKKDNNYKASTFRLIFPIRNIICFSSVMFKKKILKDINFFHKYYSYSNDYYFLLKVFIKHKIKFINKYLVSYRVHPNQKTQLPNMKLQIVEEDINHLKWVKKNFLINKFNIFLFYKEFIKKHVKFFYFKFQKVFINF
jgi:glycosyltransferase involved in cell wall biosynthesis